MSNRAKSLRSGRVKTINIQKISSVKFEYPRRFDIISLRNTNRSEIRGKVFGIVQCFSTFRVRVRERVHASVQTRKYTCMFVLEIYT